MNLDRVLWWIGGALVVAATVVCLLPAKEVRVFELNDKLYHVLGHAALAGYFTGLVPRRNWWKIFAWLVLMGVSIEFAQHYMNLGRHGDVIDVIANSLGALLGLLLGLIGLARWPTLVAWVLRRREAAP